MDIKVTLSDQDKTCAPHILCKACVENLRKCTNGTLAGFRLVYRWFRESQKYLDDCYFCFLDLKVFNRYKKKILGNTQI